MANERDTDGRQRQPPSRHGEPTTPITAIHAGLGINQDNDTPPCPFTPPSIRFAPPRLPQPLPDYPSSSANHHRHGRHGLSASSQARLDTIRAEAESNLPPNPPGTVGDAAAPGNGGNQGGNQDGNQGGIFGWCRWLGGVLGCLVRWVWPLAKVFMSLTLSVIFIFVLCSVSWPFISFVLSAMHHIDGTWASLVRFRRDVLDEQGGGALWHQAVFKAAGPLLGYASLAAGDAGRRAAFTWSTRPVKLVLPELSDTIAAHEHLYNANVGWFYFQFIQEFYPPRDEEVEGNLTGWLAEVNKRVPFMLEKADINFQLLQSELQQKPASRSFLAANATTVPNSLCRASPRWAVNLGCPQTVDFKVTRQVWLRLRELRRVLQELHDGVKLLLARAAGDGHGNGQSSPRLLIQLFTSYLCDVSQACRVQLRDGRLYRLCFRTANPDVIQRHFCKRDNRIYQPDIPMLVDQLQGAAAGFELLCLAAKMSNQQYNAFFYHGGAGLHGLLETLKLDVRLLERHQAELSSSLGEYRGVFEQAKAADVEEGMMRDMVTRWQERLQPFFYGEGEKGEKEPEMRRCGDSVVAGRWRQLFPF